MCQSAPSYLYYESRDMADNLYVVDCFRHIREYNLTTLNAANGDTKGVICRATYAILHYLD